LISASAADPAPNKGATDASRAKSYQQTTDRDLHSAAQAGLNERDLAKARDIIGMNIKNSAGETLGEVKDMVIDLPAGRELYSVIGSSTLFGGKLATVPPSALTRSADGKHLVLNMDTAKFKAAPTFESGKWPDMSDRTYGKEVYGYYGVTPYWERNGSDVNRVARVEDKEAAKATDRATRDTLKHTDKFHKASDVLGMKVENAENQKLGDIQDLLVDLRSGHIVYAVLASGGFLGLGEKYLAIPPGAFQIATDAKHLMLNVDKERLKGAPGFDKNSWPSFADQTWNSNVYSYYGQRPYWEHDRSITHTDGTVKSSDYATKPADNTAQNKKDRSGDTLTPPDQGSSDSDRQVTQQIRQALNKDESFSTYAKNVKIITQDGTVTLRGVVKTQAEKDMVESKAKQVAGVTRIDNQLEVK
jgi:sporulation protein YlmC with PRC-barrel domain